MIKQEWYKKLVQNVRKVELIKVVFGKWLIGKLIDKEYKKFGKPEYGSKRMENLAKDTEYTKRELYRCHQFFKKYEKCRTATQLPPKSWNFITNNLLPTPREDVNDLIPLPKGKYNIIYADPPWQYYEGGYKNQSQHYSTLTIDQLAEMDIQSISADNCILFLWVTFPMLPEAMELINQWGFNYSTVGFVWVKSNKNKKGFFFGLGNWTRSNVELCLIATKGSIERKDAGISQIIYSPIEKHSRKPAIVRQKIVQLIGDFSRIELFATEKIEGWDNYGTEI